MNFADVEFGDRRARAQSIELTDVEENVCAREQKVRLADRDAGGSQNPRRESRRTASLALAVPLDRGGAPRPAPPDPPTRRTI